MEPASTFSLGRSHSLHISVDLRLSSSIAFIVRVGSGLPCSSPYAAIGPGYTELLSPLLSLLLDKLTSLHCIPTLLLTPESLCLFTSQVHTLDLAPCSCFLPPAPWPGLLIDPDSFAVPCRCPMPTILFHNSKVIFIECVVAV